MLIDLFSTHEAVEKKVNSRYVSTMLSSHVSGDLFLVTVSLRL